MKLKQLLRNKKVSYILIITLVLVEISSLFLMQKTLLNKNNVLEEVKLKNNDTEMFAILLEQDDGEYIESNDSSFPNSGYWFNETLSGCMNESGQKIDGGLEYDEVSKKAKITTQETAFCYLYFDNVGEAYALLTNSDTVSDVSGQTKYNMTFVRSKTPYNVGDTYNGKEVEYVFTGFENSASHPWTNYNINNIDIVDEIKPINMSGWFSLYDFGYNSTSENPMILDLTKINTSNMTDMSKVFSGFLEYIGNSSRYITVDLTGWDTSNVTNMSEMFRRVINESNGTVFFKGMKDWDVSNVTNMSYMFGDTGYMRAPTFENLGNWNTSNVTNMSYMFSGCLNYNYSAILNNSDLGISNWDVSNVTDMSYMFAYAVINTHVDLSSWDVYNVRSYDAFNSDTLGTGTIIPPNFYTSYALLTESTYNESWSTLMSDLIFVRTTGSYEVGDLYNGNEILEVYTGFETTTSVPWYKADEDMFIANVKFENEIKPISTSGWFKYFWATEKIDMTNLNTSLVADMSNMFACEECYDLEIVGLENLDTRNVTNMSNMFSFYEMQDTIINFDLSKWDVSNVTNMSNMFDLSFGSIPLSLDVTGWDTSKVTNMSSMFSIDGGNPSIEKLAGIENWDTSSVTNMSNMFNGMTINTNINLSKWNTSKVTNYAGFNSNVSGSGTLTLPTWPTT